MKIDSFIFLFINTKINNAIIQFKKILKKHL